MSADGGPAFPTQNGCSTDDGMSLRDWFAGMALQGIIQRGKDAPAFRGKIIAGDAYHIADAMIEARNFENPYQPCGERKEDA